MSAAASTQELLDLTRSVRVFARVARDAEQVCLTTGISLPQYRLLACVSEGPMRASALAAQVRVSRPTLTSLVDGLTAAGLLRRVPVPTDRRGIALEATEAGLAAVARADAALADRLLGLVRGEHLASVVALAEALGDALEAARS